MIIMLVSKNLCVLGGGRCFFMLSPLLINNYYNTNIPNRYMFLYNLFAFFIKMLSKL